MQKIALTGKARSGKDTLAKFLQEDHEYMKFAFGDELKRRAHNMFPHLLPKDGGKPRELYQKFGQAMRSVDPDIWVRYTLNEIHAEVDFMKSRKVFTEEDFRFVVTDLRQPNEYEALKKEGFMIVRVTAPDDIRKQRMIDLGDQFSDSDLQHETEQHIDSFNVDYTVINDGSMEILRASAKTLHECVCGKQ